MDAPPEPTHAGRADEPDEVSLIDIVLVLCRRLRLLVWAPLAVGLLTLGISFLIKPTFTATVQILPPQQQTSTAAAILGSLGGAAGALGGSLSGLKNPADQWVGLLQSRVIADALIQRFDLKNLYESEYQFQTRNALAGNTRISAGKDGLIDIEVDDHEPERAAKMANAYVEELQRLTTSLAVTEAAQRRVFFQKQLDEAKAGLVRAEVALKEGGISASVLKTSPDAAVGQLAQIQAAVAAQEVKVQVLRGSMTESNPELRQAMLELASLREQLRRAEQATPGQGKADAAQYVERFREFKYYETLFELFARQYELARADEAKDGALVQVVDPAVVPEYKSKPKRAMLAVLATVLTFMLCASWVLIANALQNYRLRPGGADKLDQLCQAVWRRTRNT